jgi:hypothetical protein
MTDLTNINAKQIEKEYFSWLLSFISPCRRYTKVLRKLFDTEFVYSIKLDENRSHDGRDLRFRFIDEKHQSATHLIRYIDNRKCSILEMMIALSIRIEDFIMSDDKYGNRTSEWFHSMFKSLGLNESNNDNYDREYVETVIYVFLNRHYKSSGEGGLFTVRNHRLDMRNIEIWYQMTNYLNEIIEEGD